MNENKAIYDVDIWQIIGLILKRWWILLLTTVICTVAFFSYSKFLITPTYQAKATLLINGGNSVSTTYQEILAGQVQSKDYPYILRSNLTLEEVANKLNNYDFSENDGVPYRNYTPSVLASMISSTSVDESRIFIIHVSSPYPEETRIVANTIVEVFPDRVEKLIRGGSVGIVDLAITPTSYSSPDLSHNTLIGFTIGLILGIVIALMAGLSNDTIESENWITDSFKDDIPLLATIPDTSSSSYKYDKYNRYRYKYGQSYSSKTK